MPKLAKNYYYNRAGEKKVNCYILHIPKETLKKSSINEDDEVKTVVKEGKIIVEKA